MKKIDFNIIRILHLNRLHLHILPILVWLAALAGILSLIQRQAESFEIVGIAFSRLSEVSATQTGRLKSVRVELFEEVKRDQTLAILDDQLLRAQMATANAEIDKLAVEIKTTRQRLAVEQADRQTDLIATHRQFSLDVERYRLQRLELIATLEPARIRLENFKLDNKIYLMQDGFADNNLAPYELQKLKLEHDELARLIQDNQLLLEQADMNLGKAEQRLEEFIESQPTFASSDSELELIQKSINIQEKQIEQVSIELAGLVLKSPYDGMVSQLHIRTGAAVLPGEAILTVAETSPTEIVAYADETSVDQIKELMKVELIKSTDPPQTASSQVVHMGPAMEMMPERLWQNPNVPQWGRPFMIKVPPNFELIPGELVGIKIL